VSTVGAEERLERYPEAGSAFNIGMMVFGERSLPFVEQWIEVRGWGGAWGGGRGSGVRRVGVEVWGLGNAVGVGVGVKLG